MEESTRTRLWPRPARVLSLALLTRVSCVLTLRSSASRDRETVQITVVSPHPYDYELRPRAPLWFLVDSPPVV